MIHMGRLAETFSLASRIRHSNNALHHYYELRLVSARGGAIRSSSGVLIWTDAVDVHYAKDVDALFALAGTAPSIEREERLLSWLRHTYPHAQVVHGIGGGQSALAMAGLEPKDGGFPKTGGSSLPLGELHAHGTTGIDAEAACALTSALSIVTHDCGHETASEVADTLLRATPKRFTHAVLDSRESRASDLIRTSANQLRVNSENRVSIAEAAQAVAMSERNFLRRFKQEIGVTPSEFVLRVRLEKACHMLVDTDLPADKIARRTGLGSGDRLAKLFRQRLSTSPTQYRTAERNRPAENGSSEPVAARRVRRPAS
ncbi:HTH-type transcriptional regulator CdhR [Paraburkholderia fynbosensis]|uniref:HTH-type transcriptional regulator CdhR n=2 Tax=Paraburkholderia fynbosensis TaxID=1200993 RepID=A0A6J5H4D1_9BURK|nr:HTH-type transcriptional regulator CdhR [Paraburkholderia fynbosensis]